MKGPAIFLAQFMGDTAPYNSLESICKWVAEMGYKGIQIPTWESRLIDLDKAADSKTYCDELAGKVRDFGLEITELSTHLQGQLIAVHPAFDDGFDVFAPQHFRKNPKARQAWAVEQLKKAGIASKHLGLSAHATFSGAFIWPFFYAWPQRPHGLVDEAFGELAKRWKPILDHFDDNGIDLAFEIHPGEDLHDGISFERFLDKLDNHPRCNILYDPSHLLLQQLDYITFIDHYHEKIKAFHVKDAEFNPTGKSGVYGGYQDWVDRPGRFRSLGDGQVDFKKIFSKLTQYNYSSWAVMEWECCIKSPEQGAIEGAPFILEHMITKTEKAFDDFAGEETDVESLRRIMGIE